MPGDRGEEDEQEEEEEEGAPIHKATSDKLGHHHVPLGNHEPLKQL